MLNIDEFTKRLQMLLDYYHLSASAFADSIDVQRSGISHILSGRNKPSLDFVLKVTNVYKDVTIPWLLFGEGIFPPSKGASTITNITVTEDLFTDNNTNSNQPSEDLEDNNTSTTAHIPDTVTVNKTDNTISNINTVHNLPKTTTQKEVSKIVFFYTDNTFETYYPST